MNYLNLLSDRNKTCIIFNNKSIVFESTNRGVQPLIDFLSTKPNINNEYILVDKIIGKGAIILSKLIGVLEIHTPIISKDALNLAREYQIDVHYVNEVDFIQNRTKTGRCPIESCVLEINDPYIGYKKIIETLERLKKAA